jgi:hypothetical protein
MRLFVIQPRFVVLMCAFCRICNSEQTRAYMQWRVWVRTSCLVVARAWCQLMRQRTPSGQRAAVESSQCVPRVIVQRAYGRACAYNGTIDRLAPNVAHSVDSVRSHTTQCVCAVRGWPFTPVLCDHKLISRHPIDCRTVLIRFAAQSQRHHHRALGNRDTSCGRASSTAQGRRGMASTTRPRWCSTAACSSCRLSTTGQCAFETYEA